jgi:hypothetical protein
VLSPSNERLPFSKNNNTDEKLDSKVPFVDTDTKPADTKASPDLRSVALTDSSWPSQFVPRSRESTGLSSEEHMEMYVEIAENSVSRCIRRNFVRRLSSLYFGITGRLQG